MVSVSQHSTLRMILFRFRLAKGKQRDEIQTEQITKRCLLTSFFITKTKVNSVAIVRKRTIPTERPPLVGEVSANHLWVEGVAWTEQRIPTAVNLGFLDRSRYFFI
jgi:hypothetical protein